jgi:hypothetical protein
MHHMMVELFSFDDVGQAYDIALTDPERVGVTLGRHTNDHVTSFYSRSPSDFMVEYGWGGRCVTPGNWVVEEYTVGPSLWGHERIWLSPEKRAEARAMRLKLAEDGVRHPVQLCKFRCSRCWPSSKKCSSSRPRRRDNADRSASSSKRSQS